MDIYSKPGTPVKFTCEGGYPFEQDRAKKLLSVGRVYTVERTIVDAWHTDVFLKEVPGKAFNSVLFEDASRLPSDHRGTE